MICVTAMRSCPLKAEMTLRLFRVISVMQQQASRWTCTDMCPRRCGNSQQIAWSALSSKSPYQQVHNMAARVNPSNSFQSIKGQIKGQRAQKSPVSIENTGFLLAQKEGFEPSRAFYTPTPLAGEPLRPLGYFCTRCRFSMIAQRLDDVNMKNQKSAASSLSRAA